MYSRDECSSSHFNTHIDYINNQNLPLSVPHLIQEQHTGKSGDFGSSPDLNW